MRRTVMLVVAAVFLMIMPGTGAHADEWCGYATHANSIIECGYSSDTECENAIGKGGMCFVDPDYALNEEHNTPPIAARLLAVPA